MGQMGILTLQAPLTTPLNKHSSAKAREMLDRHLREPNLTVGLQAAAESWRVVYHGRPNSIDSLIRLRSKSDLVPHWMFFVRLHDASHQLRPAVCFLLRRVPVGTLLQKASQLLSVPCACLSEENTIEHCVPGFWMYTGLAGNE